MKRPARRRGPVLGYAQISSDFPQDLVKKGYRPNGERHGVDPGRHLMHKFGSAPALDKRAVVYWCRHGYRELRVFLTDGQCMTMKVADFLASAIDINIGHGAQLIAHRRYWWIEGDTAQLRLFGAA